MVCSISSVIRVAARLEAQHPLAAPHDKADQPETGDQDDPHFGPHPRRKSPRARDHAVDALAKAVAARRQRLFVLASEDQRLFGWWGDNGARLIGVGLFDRKTAVINVIRSRHGRSEQKTNRGKDAETHDQSS